MPDVYSRRQFLRQAACAGVGYGAAMATVLDLCKLNAIAAPLSATDFRALVCVFLYGGNDGNNTIVPRTGADYQLYASTRGGLTLPASSLLPITPTSDTSDGREYGLHPNLGGIRDLFDRGKIALLFNVGPLVAPLTQKEFKERTAAVPRNLFSHTDQVVVWQSSVAEKESATGWGGRIADLLHSLNSNTRVSMSISAGGTNTFQVGRNVFQYHVEPTGAIQLAGYTPGSTIDPESMALDRILALQNRNIFENAYRTRTREAIDVQQIVSSALAASAPITTVFPDSSLGKQLQIVARLLAARTGLGHQRQVYFCSVGGFDTHGTQLRDHPPLLTELNDALPAFYDATVELGLSDRVTTFTASDFGRTLTTSYAGSDHGWGNHHLIMGDAVRGKRIFGQFPILAVDGPDDSGEGRWIPTTSVDEYSATLAKWFGISASDMPLIFPNIGRFANPDLGFLA